MLARSIPDYAGMRARVTEAALHHVQPGSCAVDLGCSRGAALAAIRRQAADLRCVGIESSQDMQQGDIVKPIPGAYSSLTSGCSRYDDAIVVGHATPEQLAAVEHRRLG